MSEQSAEPDADAPEVAEPEQVESEEAPVAEPEQEPQYRRFDCTGDDQDALAEAAEAARRAVEDGECVVLPTDTVYGIGADAFSAEAVQRLLDAKERGRDMPPPVLIAEPGLIRALASDIPEAAHALVERHWPGALTVVFKAQPSLRMDLGETNGTVAVRVPDHDLARELLRRTGPMAVSSANLSGHPAALSIDDAIEQLGDKVSVYLDGGALGEADTPPSTIIDFTHSEHGKVLRHGALSVEVLRETCPDLEDLEDKSSRPTLGAAEDLKAQINGMLVTSLNDADNDADPDETAPESADKTDDETESADAEDVKAQIEAAADTPDQDEPDEQVSPPPGG